MHLQVSQHHQLRSRNFEDIKLYILNLKGSIKSISTSDNLLLVGFSTGLMCLLDMRTGWIQESCKTLDNEILQVRIDKVEFKIKTTDPDLNLNS